MYICGNGASFCINCNEKQQTIYPMLFLYFKSWLDIEYFIRDINENYNNMPRTNICIRGQSANYKNMYFMQDNRKTKN